MNDSLTLEIKNIYLPDIVTGAGVELKPTGKTFTGICPFHADKNPSFHVYMDKRRGAWKYHCFGCAAGGDAVDFVREINGVDFKSALIQLGIKEGRLSEDQKHKIKAEKKSRKKRSKRKKILEKWQRSAIFHYSVLIRSTHKAKQKLTPKNFNEYAKILDPLAKWEYYHSILTGGNEEELFLLFKEHLENKVILMQRNFLFKKGY